MDNNPIEVPALSVAWFLACWLAHLTASRVDPDRPGWRSNLFLGLALVIGARVIYLIW